MKLLKKLFVRSQTKQNTNSKQNMDPSGSTENIQETPLTDEAVKQILQTGYHVRVNAEFARQLERELNKLKYERK
jgi:hypothetical protein